MTQLEENNLEQIGFHKAFSKDHSVVWVDGDRGTVACVVTRDYIPINDFKELFSEIGAIVRENAISKFIFDKRALRTFHQPSMEWYYIEWKTEMVAYGLTQHRKLLPELPWFAKAVEIAKKPLLDKMPQDLVDQLNIRYCDSLEEAAEV